MACEIGGLAATASSNYARRPPDRLSNS